MDRIQYLSQFNLLRSLSSEDLIEMDELTSITTFPKYTFIQTPDTFTEGLYFVKRGKVRLYRLNEEGKQFTLDILREGNIFGEMGDISLGTRGLFIETVEESDICVMDKERFEGYLLRRPRFMLNMIKVMSERLSHMSSLAQSLALGKLHDKIIHVLAELSERFGVQDDGDDYSRIDMPLSHQEIAHLVGASREAVSVALKELAEAGMLRTRFRTVTVHRDILRAAQKLAQDDSL
ncbi:Crp/Fnr family transcriptional regulator [Brevibacillus sp. FSL K6-0770]|uniref:Crp/Fnr family transcriptional regulator n=1 Tax=unclassified Brevibacillus TaxID=2684853 RepID=UPI00156B9B90|nr:Crp/Fnr family transcriptional regulator [Brevibacillus sp. HD1.4A]NRQ55792.1 Crp/Fnr family transcriptional regulator [Brevibacillus sp. HD1.4A]